MGSPPDWKPPYGGFRNLRRVKRHLYQLYPKTKFFVIWVSLYGHDTRNIHELDWLFQLDDEIHPTTRWFKVPFSSPIVGGHWTPWKGHLTIRKISGCFTTPLEHTPKPLPTGYEGIPFIVWWWNQLDDFLQSHHIKKWVEKTPNLSSQWFNQSALFIPDRWRSPTSFPKRARFHHPQKVTNWITWKSTLLVSRFPTRI